MSGFIDPQQPIDDRLDRLEALIDEALRQLPISALSPEAQRLHADLTSSNAMRQERARRRVKALMDADPLSLEGPDQ